MPCTPDRFPPRCAHATQRPDPLAARLHAASTPRVPDPRPADERKTMHPSQPASLLVAALVMLRRPCARNRATAHLLLTRAADFPQLSPAERDACLGIADELDSTPAEPDAPASPRPRTQLAPRRTVHAERSPGLVTAQSRAEAVADV